MNYTANEIAGIVGSSSEAGDAPILRLALDSRRLPSPATTLFFALKGPRRNGHQFLTEVYNRGVRNFVVSEEVREGDLPGSNLILVRDTLDALQKLAAHHRRRFNIPVIGITGSNGKTVVKEWLYQLLHADYNIVRSPRSYNSQTGVPLSIWQMSEEHTLAIFEAGISQPGEMQRLEEMIRPDIGVLTNIGEAHSEGFASIEQKLAEKEILFRNAKRPALLRDVTVKHGDGETEISASHPSKKERISITIPFTDDASIQNAITCWQVLLHLGYANELIAERMRLLSPVNMRMELKKAINNCTLVNDSYSADLSSLEIALGFLEQQGQDAKKTVILSDFLQSALKDEQLYSLILEQLQKHAVDRVIGIGERISKHLRLQSIRQGFPGKVEGFATTEDFLRQFRSSQFRDESILIKGARVFAFERIVQLLELKLHQTVLEINLNAIAHNLKVYQRSLNPNTKIMAMVKAFAYGSGGAEIAGILQFHKVDYLAVAYADEGVELRNAGITLPIMVMNPEESAFDLLIENDLEPDIFSFHLLEKFGSFLQDAGITSYPVHIEIETGMNRLGFQPDEVDRLIGILGKNQHVRLQSVFTHLAASEEPAQDVFSLAQFKTFNGVADRLSKSLSYSFLRHIANSAAIFRLPSLQLDMVRLGIGLYGVDSGGSHQQQLEPVATLRTTIAQLKKVPKGESVSYNRRAVVDRDSIIATVRIGYADGFSRRLGNGVGKMWVKGKLAPVVGTVCMDMTMIDVSDISGVKEGDDVIIFGKELPIQKLAEWAGTIPYEVMTGISQRVKRVYYEE